MKINYCITVHDEQDEFSALLKHILEHKNESDTITVLHDISTSRAKDLESRNAKQDAIEVISILSNGHYDDILYHAGFFEGDFAKWKNMFKALVPVDEYICQLDADEMVSEYFLNHIGSVVEANGADLFYLPRINRVEGITDKDIAQWGWKVNEKGFINYPDFQGRIYKNTKDIKWVGNVHESIKGHKTIVAIPENMEHLALIHNKQINKQRIQNQYYNNL